LYINGNDFFVSFWWTRRGLGSGTMGYGKWIEMVKLEGEQWFSKVDSGFLNDTRRLVV
jgi:hypothetical protein